MHQLAARSIMWLKAVKKMSLMSSQFQEFACYWKALQYVSQQIKAWLVKGSGTTFHNILFPDVDILLLPWCHLLRQLVFKHFWNNRHFCFESFFFFSTNIKEVLWTQFPPTSYTYHGFTWSFHHNVQGFFSLYIFLITK